MAIYSDLQFNIDDSNDILIDENSIHQSIKNILFTNKGERQFDPEFGSNLNQLLFEKMNPITELTLENEIIFSLQNYEPRISINNVEIDSDYNQQTYSVSIYYMINKLNTTGNIDLSLQIQGV